MRKRIQVILMWFVLLSGCQKNFNPGVPGDKKMVVNSMFNSDGPMVVYLTTSYPASNKNNNVVAIADAHIGLYEDNVLQEYLHYVPSDTFGYYASNLTPQDGKIYSIQVSEKNYPTATAIDTIPVAPQIISCNLLQFPDSLRGNVMVNMVFKDNPGVVNYYQVDMYLSGTQYAINQDGDTVLESFTSTIEPYVSPPLNDTARGPSNYLLFSSRGFSGQQKQLQILGSVKALAPYVATANLFVELHAVSRAHYEYYQSLQVYHSVNGTTGIESYVYDNIVNGYGIFCGENWQENTFIIR